jgi:hypothetical protein
VIHDGGTEADGLPLGVERQVADDLAYVAAVMEGAQSVAAVCLEQHLGTKLVVRVAGMDVMDEKVRVMLNEIARLLESAATCNGGFEKLKENMLTLITEQHSQKLLGRMRSVKWTKPTYLRKTHKKPLAKDFENLIHRVQHAYPAKGERHTRKTLTDLVLGLSKRYETFECTNFDNELLELQRLVRSTYEWCRSPEVGSFASNLETIPSPTPQIAAAIKTLRQLEKIGAYLRIASSLVDTAVMFPMSFRCIRIEHVVPYAEAPTDIAYESWAKVKHVHAEVQLVVEYALRQQGEIEQSSHNGENGHLVIWPRTIGTSKYLCYLCYLFLREHGGFGQTLNSHGRLFDQWTVPDLENYSGETKDRLAGVLLRMNDAILRRAEALGSDAIWRPEPMTSRQNLLAGVDGAEVGDSASMLADRMAAVSM